MNAYVVRQWRSFFSQIGTKQEYKEAKDGKRKQKGAKDGKRLKTKILKEYLCRNMSSKISKFVDDIAADPKKGIIWVILILIIIAAIYFAWGKIKGLFSDIGNSINSVKDNPVDNAKLSHDAAWYRNAADTLFTAMDGWGTDESPIDSVIAQIYNQDDWNKLVREYGTRKLRQPWWQPDLSGTLQVHLRSDCSSKHITQIRNTLAQKQINSGL